MLNDLYLPCFACVLWVICFKVNLNWEGKTAIPFLSHSKWWDFHHWKKKMSKLICHFFTKRKLKTSVYTVYIFCITYWKCFLPLFGFVKLLWRVNTIFSTNASMRAPLAPWTNTSQSCVNPSLVLCCRTVALWPISIVTTTLWKLININYSAGVRLVIMTESEGESGCGGGNIDVIQVIKIKIILKKNKKRMKTKKWLDGMIKYGDTYGVTM